MNKGVPRNLNKPDASSGCQYSRLYTGWIRHRRFVPVSHQFRYPIFMFYLDLDELDQVFKNTWYASVESFNLLSFRRKDYFQPEQPCLKTAVIHAVTDHCQQQGTVIPPITRVCMLTHLRVLNWVFNPVTFYYCFDQHNQLQCILSEITNTPWNERHHYVLPVNPTTSETAIHSETSSETAINWRSVGQQKHVFTFNKAFHVSPFNPMNMSYRWVFSEPQQQLHVHMENHLRTVHKEAKPHKESKPHTEPKLHSEPNLLSTPNPNELSERHFDATLRLEQASLSSDLTRTLIRQPWITVKVVSGIYWQAFKLWCKRAPFYSHPKWQDQNTEPSDPNAIKTDPKAEPSNPDFSKFNRERIRNEQ